MGIIPSKRKGKSRAQGNPEKRGGTFFLFLFTLFFAPLAFGTTEPWSIFTLELLVAVSCLVFLQPFSHKKRIFYRPPGLLPLLLLLGWIFFQTIPLPPFIVGWLAPDIYHVYQPVLDLPRQIGGIFPDHWIPLTVNRKASLLEALRLCSYVLFYLLTVQLLTSSRRLVVTVNAVSWLALCLALLAVVQRMTAPDTLFWFRQLTGGKTAFGPWVYKNHYAGFMVMLCPLVLAQFILYRPALEHLKTIREKILAFFSEKGIAIHLIMGFGSLVLLASVFLTQSRGGILSILCSVLCFFILLFLRQGKVDKLSLILLSIGVLIIVGWYGWDPVWNRFTSIINQETGTIQDDRLLIWTDSLRIIADFPITGTGFGTFVDIFPYYKTISDHLLYEHAHNDFIELLTDGGAVAGFLAFCWIFSVLKTGYRSIRVRQDTMSVLLAMGALSALVGLLVFSIFDFNLHNGANGLYFAFFCGLLVSAGNTRRYYQTSPTLLKPWKSSHKVQGIALLGLLFFLCATLVIQGRKMVAEKYYQQALSVVSLPYLKPFRKQERVYNLIEKAKKTDPLTGLYAYALANITRLQERGQEALRLSAEAVLQQPMHFAYLQQLGSLVARIDLIQARLLMETGYKRSQQKDIAFQVWAEFELLHPLRKEGLIRLRKEIEHNKHLTSLLYPLLTKFQLDQQELVAVLPDRSALWFAFWSHLKREGKTEQYSFVIEHVLAYIDKEPRVHQHYFKEAARYYRVKKKEQKEESALLLGIQYVPAYAPFHIQLGEIYLKRGHQKGAIEQFERALLLDPKNEGIDRAIRKIKLAE